MISTPILVRSIRWGVCLIILAAIIAGLYVSGSPTNQRRISLDERRVSSLMQISNGIDTYFDTKGSLPTTLDQLLSDQPYLSTELRDPTTGLPYEYTPNSTSTYSLCATFELPTQVDPTVVIPPVPVQDAWNNPTLAAHEAGRSCYSLRVRLRPSQTILPAAKPLPTAL